MPPAPAPSGRQRWWWWLVYGLAAVLAGLLVHQWSLSQPLWLDEQMLAINVRERGVLDLVGALWLAQSAPPGWLMMERAALQVFGDGERSLRALPLAFGLGTIGMAVLVGRRWLRPAGAACFVVLCGLGPWLAYHALELKPYSADAFWGLTLPALAAWAIEGSPSVVGRRIVVWWVSAAAAVWLSLGALFVAPACIVALATAAWRQQGRSAGLTLAAGGAGWLVSVTAFYWLSLASAAGNATLQSYWAFAFPPAGATLAESSRWLLDQLGSVAAKPGGTEHPVLLLGAAAAGLLLATSRTPWFGRILAFVPLSMCALAVARLVPMYERLTLWALPALYFGLASAVEAGAGAAARGLRASRWPVVLLAGLLGAIGLFVAVDIARTGLVDRNSRLAAPSSNHDLDDRAAQAWLAAMLAPGDVVITTRLALPALWWYGRSAVSAPGLGRTLPGGTPIVEAYAAAPDECRPEEIEALFGRHDRAMIYLGFRFDDVPAHFDDLMLDQASGFGRIVAYRGFAASGGVAVVDLRLPPLDRDAAGPLRPGGLPRGELARLGGCMGVRPATRW